MNNICMPLLNKVPLAYNQKCLLGIWSISHHPGVMKIDPFKGIVEMSQGCNGAMMVKGYLLDDTAETNNWVYINKGLHYYNSPNFTVDLRNYGFTGTQNFDPSLKDIYNPKYWEVANVYSLYYDCRMWVSPYGCGGSLPPGVYRQGGLPLEFCEPLWTPLKPNKEYKEIISTRRYCNESGIFLGVENGYFKFQLAGIPGVGADIGAHDPVYIHYFILNFDQNRYSKDHLINT